MGWTEQSQGIMRKWQLACLVLLQQLKKNCFNAPSKPIQLEMTLFPYYTCGNWGTQMKPNTMNQGMDLQSKSKI